MSHRAILEGKAVKPCDDLIDWARWFEKAHRHVACDEKDGVKVSTIFLGLDHGFGKPQWFETMIFGGDFDEYCERYETWDEAEAGHRAALQFAFTKKGA